MFDFSDRSQEESARISQMKAGWDAYFGRFPAPLQNRPRKVSDAVTVNRCKPIVDKGVAFLFGKQVEFQVATEAADGAQEWLDGAWKANRKQTLLQKLGINGGVCGHAFVKLVPAQPYPRLIVLDPTTVSVEYAPDDIDTISAYHIEYSGTNGAGQSTDFRQTIHRTSPMAWEIVDQQQSGRQWVTVDTTPWPYAFGPIVECQNLPAPNQFWGISDISPDIIQLNRDLNLVFSNIQRVIKYHAFPKTWVTGLGGNKLQVGPDETLVLPEGAQMGSLEMKSDLSSSMNFATHLETAMDVLSRTPSLALGDLKDVPRGTISGSAIELLFAPLVEKVDAKRRLYGDLLEELCRRLLVIRGYAPDLDVYIHWPEILPTDPVTVAQVAQMYLAMGVSKDTVFSQMGFDYAEETEKLAQEAQDAADDASAPNPPLVNTTSASETEPDQADTALAA